MINDVIGSLNNFEKTSTKKMNMETSERKKERKKERRQNPKSIKKKRKKERKKKGDKIRRI